MSEICKEHFEPIIDNYKNEIHFSKFINQIQGEKLDKCNPEQVNIENNEVCMSINGDENVLIDEDKLYTGICLPNTLVNTLKYKTINNQDELKTLNSCAKEIGEEPIYVGYKKGIDPSLYGLNMSIKCDNGENYLCPVFEKLSKKLMSKCEKKKGLIECKLGNLDENEKKELESCLNMVNSKCGNNKKIVVEYKCQDNNIVKQFDGIDNVELSCKNENEYEMERCLGTSDKVNYNNYRVPLSKCDKNNVPIYYNPNHKLDENKIKKGVENEVNKHYNSSYDNVLSMEEKIKDSKNKLKELKTYAENNNFNIENLREDLDASDNQPQALGDAADNNEDLTEIQNKINELKTLIDNEDGNNSLSELDIAKRNLERINKEIERYNSNNEKKKKIVNLLNKVIFLLIIILLFTIAYVGISKGVLNKNTQNKLNAFMRNQIQVN